MSADGGRTPAHIVGSKTPAWGMDGSRSSYDRGNVGAIILVHKNDIKLMFGCFRGPLLGTLGPERHMLHLVTVVHGMRVRKHQAALATLQMGMTILRAVQKPLVPLDTVPHHPISHQAHRTTPPQHLETLCQLPPLVVYPLQRHQLCQHLHLVHQVDLALIQLQHLLHTTRLLQALLVAMEVLGTREAPAVVTTKGHQPQPQLVEGIAVQGHQGYGAAVMMTENQDIQLPVHSRGGGARATTHSKCWPVILIYVNST